MRVSLPSPSITDTGRRNRVWSCTPLVADADADLPLPAITKGKRERPADPISPFLNRPARAVPVSHPFRDKIA
jgi:hypothetical protein